MGEGQCLAGSQSQFQPWQKAKPLDPTTVSQVPHLQKRQRPLLCDVKLKAGGEDVVKKTTEWNRHELNTPLLPSVPTVALAHAHWWYLALHLS